jgi:hypothetical protein
MQKVAVLLLSTLLLAVARQGGGLRLCPLRREWQLPSLARGRGSQRAPPPRAGSCGVARLREAARSPLRALARRRRHGAGRRGCARARAAGALHGAQVRASRLRTRAAAPRCPSSSRTAKPSRDRPQPERPRAASAPAAAPAFALTRRAHPRAVRSRPRVAPPPGPASAPWTATQTQRARAAF